MTNYRIVSVNVENRDEAGRPVPERILARVQVGKAPRLAEVELTRADAYRLANHLLGALFQTGEPS